MVYDQIYSTTLFPDNVKKKLLTLVCQKKNKLSFNFIFFEYLIDVNCLILIQIDP